MQRCLLKIGPPLGPWDITVHPPLISPYMLLCKLKEWKTFIRSIIMFQVKLYKRPFIRFKRSFEVICPHWHYLGVNYKIWFCKVEKGRQLSKLDQGGHDAATKTFPIFCISFYPNQPTTLKECEWGVLSSIYLSTHWNQTSSKYWPPLIAQQWKVSWGTLIESFFQIQSCLLQLRCKEALRQQIAL